MRMMLRILMPVEGGNAAFKSGSLQTTIQGLIEKLKPEAAYFFPDEGKRSALFVFDMKDSAQIPPLVEPLFAGLNAQVRLTPVMNAEDLQKGMGEAAKAR
jgi:hypothetical protein